MTKLERNARVRSPTRPNALASFAAHSPRMSGQNVRHVMQPAAPMTALARDAMALDGSLSDAKSVGNSLRLINFLRSSRACAHAPDGAAWRALLLRSAECAHASHRTSCRPLQGCDRPRRQCRTACAGYAAHVG